MAELLEDLGHNIRRLREERGWNQTELGFRADMSPSIVSLIENGKRNPSTATLGKIAGALGVEVVDLFPKAKALPSLLDELEEGRRIVQGEAHLQGTGRLEAAGRVKAIMQAVDEYTEGKISREELEGRVLELELAA